MRAMFMVVASIFLAIGLLGCNRQQQVAVQAPVTVTPPPAALPPPPPPPAPVVEASHRARHHRHHYAETQSYGSYSDSESASYTQSDDSENDYDGGSASTESYEHSAAAEAHGEVWVDGYGREHYGVNAPDDNPGALSAEDEHRRAKPYRGWNSDCDRR